MIQQKKILKFSLILNQIRGFLSVNFLLGVSGVRLADRKAS